MKFNISEFIKRAKVCGLKTDNSEQAIFNASLDHTRVSFKPDVVVKICKTAEVGKALKIANDLRIPVTVRGSGTGCAGGAIPMCAGIVLDMSGLNFIKINPATRIAHVGAGAVTADIDNLASTHGFFYPPDPSSHKFSSIGGNIACNAGGLRAAKYGVTRDYVLALTVFLADGTKLNCARPLRKFASGENLRDMFIGTEGSLGVIAEAWLKLLPAPSKRTFAIAFFKDDYNAFENIERIMKSRLQPSMLEFMDSLTIDCVRLRNTGLKIEKGMAAVLAEFDSYCGADCDLQAKEFVKLLSDCDCRFAKSLAEAESFRNIRRISSPAMYALADSKVSQDIVLPLDATVKYFKMYRKIAEQSKLPAPVFGHAADGNYHIHFMYNKDEKNGRSKALRYMDKAVKAAVKCGGSVSGEHGIGIFKAKYMDLQHTEAEMSLLRSIKKLLDSKNILNRGKIFVSTDLDSIKPLTNIKLPWD